ncbi:MAG: DUF86 domain-containing protein [Cyclobacteriaceae bacterium]
MKKDDSVYIEHIMNGLNKIEKYTGDMDQKHFFASDLVQDAVIRQLQVIGEATKKISNDYKGHHSEIPWKDMAGMRDKLTHDYIGVDLWIDGKRPNQMSQC